MNAGEALSERQIAAYENLLAHERNWKKEKEVADAAHLEKERRAQDEKLAREREEESRKAEARKAAYVRDFNAISSPDDAKAFKSKYSGWNDPGDLTSKAMKKGLEAGIASAKSCIDYSNRVIQRQKEIGAEVGYVDKAALYQAGASLVACKKQLAQYRATARNP